MAIGPRLDLRQTQSLVMTPQLQQAIRLLQMSSVELTTYVEQEIERNPLLEAQEGEPQEIRETVAAADQAREAPPPAPPSTRDTAEMSRQDTLPAEQDQPLDTDSNATWEGADERAGGPGEGVSDAWNRGRDGAAGSDGDFEGRLSRSVTLREHLIDQLHVDVTDLQLRLIGAHLIDLIDESGYLEGDLGAVAELMGCDLGTVEQALAAIQRFDPPGIGARSLRECLELQLRDRNRLDPAMAALLDHLDLVGRSDLVGLQRACKVDADDVLDMIAEIRALNPKPGLAFEVEVTQSVVPDVFVRPHLDGGWLVELNSDTLPRVLVNEQYYAKVNHLARTKVERDYLAERFQSANWLVKSLNQRAITILKVATEIVRQQDWFLTHGVKRMRPLVLRDIATAIGMHESTVSRVTTNKYMATPRGIHELKYFFTTAIPSSEGGDAHSSEAVRFRIREMIEREGGRTILSDDGIVEALKRDGIGIARRTVAKYREAMGINSSVERRRRARVAM
ncbi:MAG: RNA polymerase sigma-54 factor [Alphaproteobacteria bacterium]|nr:RNA polymerase sigma-54 factor [Alphaproteobacteria bacterium]